ncbi:hypothetical protein BD626DRAFT_491611 [Schizophyllum amplum]|uniref:Uncharacterized protein n=1 Tax=Schizophyllum amplum TaxID=97359 RepID=A0A550CHU9_9AGAR|nr:hypothetical protein BD626DRAFT_491611 [Auriculariopsis ampla]
MLSFASGTLPPLSALAPSIWTATATVFALLFLCTRWSRLRALWREARTTYATTRDALFRAYPVHDDTWRAAALASARAEYTRFATELAPTLARLRAARSVEELVAALQTSLDADADAKHPIGKAAADYHDVQPLPFADADLPGALPASLELVAVQAELRRLAGALARANRGRRRTLALERQLYAAAAELERVERDLEDAERELEDASADSRDVKCALFVRDTEIAALRTRVDDLRARERDNRFLLGCYSTDLAAAARAKTRFKARVAELENRVRGLEEQARELEGRLKDADERLKEADERSKGMGMLKAENASLKRRNEGLVGELAVLRQGSGALEEAGTMQKEGALEREVPDDVSRPYSDDAVLPPSPLLESISLAVCDVDCVGPTTSMSVPPSPAEVVDYAPAEVVDNAPASVVDDARTLLDDHATTSAVDDAPTSTVDDAATQTVDAPSCSAAWSPLPVDSTTSSTSSPCSTASSSCLTASSPHATASPPCSRSRPIAMSSGSPTTTFCTPPASSSYTPPALPSCPPPASPPRSPRASSSCSPPATPSALQSSPPPAPLFSPPPALSSSPPPATLFCLSSFPSSLSLPPPPSPLPLRKRQGPLSDTDERDWKRWKGAENVDVEGEVVGVDVGLGEGEGMEIEKGEEIEDRKEEDGEERAEEDEDRIKEDEDRDAEEEDGEKEEQARDDPIQRENVDLDRASSHKPLLCPTITQGDETVASSDGTVVADDPSPRGGQLVTPL